MVEYTNKEGALRERPSPLPARVQDLERAIKTHKTINDYTEEVWMELYGENEEFRRFLEASTDPEAVEGSLSIDHHEATKMIRQYAQSKGDGHPLANKNLASISLALGVVRRRWNISPKQRRDRVGGQQTASSNGTEANVE